MYAGQIYGFVCKTYSSKQCLKSAKKSFWWLNASVDSILKPDSPVNTGLPWSKHFLTGKFSTCVSKVKPHHSAV